MKPLVALISALLLWGCNAPGSTIDYPTIYPLEVNGPSVEIIVAREYNFLAIGPFPVFIGVNSTYIAELTGKRDWTTFEAAPGSTIMAMAIQNASVSGLPYTFRDTQYSARKVVREDIAGPQLFIVEWRPTESKMQLHRVDQLPDNITLDQNDLVAVRMTQGGAPRPKEE